MSNDKKGFRIPVWNGLLDHYGRMKDAVWLFLFCLDKTTKEYTAEDGRRLGKVSGGMPLRDADIAESIGGCSAKVIRKWRLRLVQEGYLIQKRTPYGHVLEVAKSKKWREPGEPRELPKRASHPSERITQSEQENCPNRSRELSESASTKKTLQDSTRRSSGIAQTGNSASDGDTEVYDPHDHYFSPVRRGWKRLGIGKLAEKYRPFVEVAREIQPTPRMTVAEWGGKVLDLCKTRDVEYPAELLAIVRRYRKHDEPWFTTQEQIEQERKARGLA